MNAKGTFEDQYPRFVGPVTALALTKDERYLLAGHGDGTIKVWDMTTYREHRMLHGHEDTVVGLQVMADSNLVVSASADGTLRTWDLSGGRQQRVLRGHTQPITALSLVPGSPRVVSASTDGTLRLWNVEQGVEIFTMKGHEYDVHFVLALNDALRAVSAANNIRCTSLIWDLTTGRPIMRLPEAFGPLAVGSNDDLIVTGKHGEYDLLVWDLAHKKLLWQLRGHRRGISALDVNFGIGRAVSGSIDGSVRVWDLNTGKEVGAFKEHHGVVKSVHLIEQGRRIVSTSKDCQVLTWDCIEQRAISKFVTDGPALGCLVRRDERVIIVGDALGCVHFLENRG